MMTMRKKLKLLKTSSWEEYDDWLELYESTHDDVFWRPQWDREVYAYACLNEDQRKRFYN